LVNGSGIAAWRSSEGLYSQTSGVIDNIIHHYLIIQRITIPDMDAEDIAQEIRFKCIQALLSPKFDPDKVGTSPYSFLHRVIHNHVYNLKRGVWTVNNPPCVRCEYWDKDVRKCLAQVNHCDKMLAYQDDMQKKAALRTPVGFEKDYVENQAFEVSSIDDYILDDHVISRLPENLRSFYIDLKKGLDIPHLIRKELRRRIMRIIKED